MILFWFELELFPMTSIQPLIPTHAPENALSFMYQNLAHFPSNVIGELFKCSQDFWILIVQPCQITVPDLKYRSMFSLELVIFGVRYLRDSVTSVFLPFVITELVMTVAFQDVRRESTSGAENVHWIQVFVLPFTVVSTYLQYSSLFTDKRFNHPSPFGH